MPLLLSNVKGKAFSGFGLILFTWVWGIPGAVLAAPITVVMTITCDHLEALEHVGERPGN